MVTKCKWFHSNQIYGIDDEINRFLSSNPNIEVIALSHSAEGHNNYTALLIYKEPKKVGLW